MDKDLKEKELIEYLDEKFKGVDKEFEKVDGRLDTFTNLFTTKEEVQNLQERIDGQFTRAFEVFVTKEDIVELKQDTDSLREAVQSLTVSVDKLVKAVSDFRIEYAAVSNQLTRHEKWIQQLAEKLSIKLEY